MLGTHYETDYLLKLFEENAIGQNSKKQNLPDEQPNPDTEMPVSVQPTPTYSNDIQILFIKSDLRLVVNLQECVKAQQNTAYANKVKLSNLK